MTLLRKKCRLSFDCRENICCKKKIKNTEHSLKLIVNDNRTVFEYNEDNYQKKNVFSDIIKTNTWHHKPIDDIYVCLPNRWHHKPIGDIHVYPIGDTQFFF